MYNLVAQSDSSPTIYDLWEAEQQSSYKQFLQTPPEVGDTGFKNLQWTPDGSSIITEGEDGGVRLFVCPPDILEKPRHQNLKPIARKFFLPHINSSCVHPQFSLSDSRCLAAVAAKDFPVRLYNLIDPNGIALSSYSVQHKETEEFATILDITFSHTGTLLAVGSKRKISLFQSDQSHQHPVEELLVDSMVSALAFSSDDRLLAAGTFSGSCALYDLRSPGSAAERHQTTGHTTQILWSQDDCYIYKIHRRGPVEILDIRKDFQSIATLDSGLDTNLRVRGDTNGSAFMLGTEQGMARLWPNPIQNQNECYIQNFHDYKAITAIAANPLVGLQLLASCSAGDECCLKLWSDSEHKASPSSTT
jgi:telomerase Cajal body protein 1